MSVGRPPRVVYVGGIIGHTADVVATSVERAMVHLLKNASANEADYEQPWTCRFIDGDPELSEWTLTVHDHGEAIALYVVREKVCTAPATLDDDG